MKQYLKIKLFLFLILVFGMIVLNCGNDASGGNNPSDEKEITAFSFKSIYNIVLPTDRSSTINDTVIEITVPYGTDLTSLRPEIEITGASVSPASGDANNFENTAMYTVTADDGSTKNYLVNVNVASSSAKDITKFSINNVNGTIGTDGSIDVNLPDGTNLTNLTPTMEITGVSVNPVNAETQDFTNPVTYTVTAHDGSTKDYLVSVIASSDGKVTISGTIYLPGDDTLSNGNFSIKIKNYSVTYSSTGNWNSGHSQNYSIKVLPGDYDDIEVIVNDSSNNQMLYKYSEYFGSTITSNLTNYDINVDRMFLVSGKINLPDSDIILNGNLQISFTDMNGGTSMSESWTSGNSKTYSIELKSGNYNSIEVQVYNSNFEQIYGYFTNSANLSVDSNVTNYDINIIKLLSVSGEIILPDSDSLTTGVFSIDFSGTNTNRFYASGNWNSGHSQFYNIKVLPGNYKKITVSVRNNNDTTLYKFTTNSATLSVLNDNITYYDIDVIKLFLISGVINLPSSSTFSNGRCITIISNGKKIYSGFKSWTSGHSINYEIGVDPGQYDIIDVQVADNNGNNLYRFYTKSANISVINSNVTYNVDLLKLLSVSGNIYLPGTDTLSNGNYSIILSNDSNSSLLNSSDSFSGNWVSGQNQNYIFKEVYPGNYNRIQVSVYDADNNLLYGYYNNSVGLLLVNDNVSGYNINVIDTFAVSGTINLPDADVLSNGTYSISVLTDSELTITSSGNWSSGHSQNYNIKILPATYSKLFISVFDQAKNRIYGYFTDSANLSVVNTNVIRDIDVESTYFITGTIFLPGTDSLSNGVYFIQIPFNDIVYYYSGVWTSGHTINYNIGVLPGEYNSIEVTVYDISSGVTRYSYLNESALISVINSDVIYNIDVQQD